MKRAIGLEFFEPFETIRKNKGIDDLITKQSFDFYEFGIIVSDENDVNLFENILKTVFEAKFPLYQLDNPEQKPTFSDFGFVSTEQKSYLYEELVMPFRVSGKNERDISAALEQMDEHLVAIDCTDSKTTYFVERYHQELIEGIANAYNISVIFFL